MSETAARPAKPRWYPGWNVLAVSMLFQAIVFGIAFFSFTLWVQPWMATFAASRSEVMSVFLGGQIMMGVMAPFVGRAMDKLDLRALVISGAVAFAACLWLIARTSALWQIGVLYGTLFAIGTLLAGPLAAQTLAARWFNARRGTAIGLASVGTSLGGASIPLLVGWLLLHFDWRLAHEVLAALVLFAIIPPVWKVVRNSPSDAGIEPEADSPAAADTAPQTEWTTAALLRHRTFMSIVLLVTPLALVTGAIQQNFAPYATELSVNPARIATLVSIMAIVMVGGKIFFGMLADKIDHRLLFALALLLISVTLYLLHGTPSFAELVAVVALLGFGMGGFLPLLGAMVASRFGTLAFGRVMGLIGPFTTLAAVGPLIAGYVRDTTGSYDSAWSLMAGVLAISIAALLLLGPRPAKGVA